MNWLQYGIIPIPNPFCCLELVKKIMAGGWWWWWLVCTPVLVFSLGFGQAEQCKSLYDSTTIGQYPCMIVPLYVSLIV